MRHCGQRDHGARRVLSRAVRSAIDPDRVAGHRAATRARPNHRERVGHRKVGSDITGAGDRHRTGQRRAGAGSAPARKGRVGPRRRGQRHYRAQRINLGAVGSTRSVSTRNARRRTGHRATGAGRGLHRYRQFVGDVELRVHALRFIHRDRAGSRAAACAEPADKGGVDARRCGQRHYRSRGVDLAAVRAAGDPRRQAGYRAGAVAALGHRQRSVRQEGGRDGLGSVHRHRARIGSTTGSRGPAGEGKARSCRRRQRHQGVGAVVLGAVRSAVNPRRNADHGARRCPRPRFAHRQAVAGQGEGRGHGLGSADAHRAGGSAATGSAPAGKHRSRFRSGGQADRAVRRVGGGTVRSAVDPDRNAGDYPAAPARSNHRQRVRRSRKVCGGVLRAGDRHRTGQRRAGAGSAPARKGRVGPRRRGQRHYRAQRINLGAVGSTRSVSTRNARRRTGHRATGAGRGLHRYRQFVGDVELRVHALRFIHRDRAGSRAAACAEPADKGGVDARRCGQRHYRSRGVDLAAVRAAGDPRRQAGYRAGAVAALGHRQRSVRQEGGRDGLGSVHRHRARIGSTTGSRGPAGEGKARSCRRRQRHQGVGAVVLGAVRSAVNPRRNADHGARRCPRPRFAHRQGELVQGEGRGHVFGGPGDDRDLAGGRGAAVAFKGGNRVSPPRKGRPLLRGRSQSH